MSERSGRRSGGDSGLVGTYRGVALSLVFVGVVLAVAVVGVTALDGDASGSWTNALSSGDEVTEVGSCTVIDEPGRYELTGDVENDGGPCIHVRSDDVILDGNGHTVSGTGNTSDGSVGLLVYNGSFGGLAPETEPLTNVTVANLEVTDHGNGVALGQATIDGPRVTLRNVTATDNGDGFIMFDVGGSTFSGLTAADNADDGITIVESTFVDATDVTVTDNGQTGLSLADSVLGSNFTGVTATDNGRHGIDVGTSAVDNNITNAYVAGNERAGVEFSDSDGTHLRNATIEDNDGPGIRSDFSEADRVENVTVANNSVAYASVDDQPRYGIVAESFRLGTGASASFETNVSGLDEAEEVPDVPANATVVGPGVNLTADQGDGEPAATFTFPYDADAVEDADDLDVWQYTNGTWGRASDVTVDADAETVTGTVRESAIVVPVVTEDRERYDGDSTFVVNSTGEEEFAYAFVVNGTVERANVTSLPADDEEGIRERSDGTADVFGTSGNGEGDTFTVDGEIVKFVVYPGDAPLVLERDGEDVTDGLIDEAE